MLNLQTMRILAFILTGMLAASLQAADLPTITVEHLYYLQTRADRVRKMKPEEMVNYCLAQKIGGANFEYLYTQVANTRQDLARLLEIEGVPDTDPRVMKLRRTGEVYTRLLNDEAQRVQDGLIREGQVASDTMQAISRAQNQPR